MARALLIGCGCAAGEAGGLLLARGWSVRATSRDPEAATRIEGAGLEAAVADPDRVGSIVELCGDVAVVAWLLAGVGPAPAHDELHRHRLRSLLEKLVDTPVRGFVVELPRGSAGGEGPLAAAEEAVADAERRWRIPVRRVSGPREDVEAWAVEVADAVEAAIGLR